MRPVWKMATIASLDTQRSLAKRKLSSAATGSFSDVLVNSKGNNSVNSVRETSDDGFIVAGRYQDSENQPHAWLMRVDELGNSSTDLP